MSPLGPEPQRTAVVRSGRWRATKGGLLHPFMALSHAKDWNRAGEWGVQVGLAWRMHLAKARCVGHANVAIGS